MSRRGAFAAAVTLTATIAVATGSSADGVASAAAPRAAAQTAVELTLVDQTPWVHAGDEFSVALALSIASLSYMSATPADLELAEERQRSALALGAARHDATFHSLFESVLGRILHFRGDDAGAVDCYRRAREIAARTGDEFAERIALNQIGWSRIAAGEPQPELFTRALELSLRLRNEDGDAYALEGLAGSAAVVGDVERAGLLLGAAQALRARTGLHEQRSYVTYQSFVDAVLATDRAAEFEAARIVGRRMPRQAVLEFALDPATSIPRPSELISRSTPGLRVP